MFIITIMMSGSWISKVKKHTLVHIGLVTVKVVTMRSTLTTVYITWESPNLVPHCWNKKWLNKRISKGTFSYTFLYVWSNEFLIICLSHELEIYSRFRNMASIKPYLLYTLKHISYVFVIECMHYKMLDISYCWI